MTEDADRDLIEELAKVLWLLEKRGHITAFDDEELDEIDHMRERARNAVRRARVRLGMKP